MITNYSSSIAAISLHFNLVPHQLSIVDINSYLYRLAQEGTPSMSYLKQAIYSFEYSNEQVEFNFIN
jgi:hypothetical protein